MVDHPNSTNIHWESIMSKTFDRVLWKYKYWYNIVLFIRKITAQKMELMEFLSLDKNQRKEEISYRDLSKKEVILYWEYTGCGRHGTLREPLKYGNDGIFVVKKFSMAKGQGEKAQKSVWLVACCDPNWRSRDCINN